MADKNQAAKVAPTEDSQRKTPGIFSVYNFDEFLKDFSFVSYHKTYP